MVQKAWLKDDFITWSAEWSSGVENPGVSAEGLEGFKYKLEVQSTSNLNFTENIVVKPIENYEFEGWRSDDENNENKNK